MQKPKRAVPSDQTGQCIKEQIVTTDSVDTDVSTFVEKPKGKKDESKTKKFLDSIEAYVENDVSKMGPGTDSEHFRECCQKVSDSMQVPIEIVLRELPKFADYWTQKDENGRKQHWEKQKTFDLVKRLRTWFGNNSRFNS